MLLDFNNEKWQNKFESLKPAVKAITNDKNTINDYL